MPVSRESEDTITFELNISEAAFIYATLKCATIPNNDGFISNLYYDLQSKLGRNLQSIDSDQIFSRSVRYQPDAMEYLKRLIDEEVV